MKKTFFTLLWCCLLILGFSFSNSVSAQIQALACNDNVQISLDENCGGITPDMFLEDNPSVTATAPAFLLQITSPITGSGSSTSNATPFVGVDWSAFVGTEFSYTISLGGNSCWGTATVEDNLPPALDSGCGCTSADFAAFVAAGTDLATWPCAIQCGQDIGDSEAFINDVLGINPIFSDNCENGGVAGTAGSFESISYSGVIAGTSGDLCSTTATTYGWTWNGSLHGTALSQVLCDVVIVELPIDLSTVIFPNDPVTLACGGDYPTPGVIMDGDVANIPDAWPHYVGSAGIVRITDTENACNLASSYEDTEFPEACPVTLKILRKWTVIDWCTGTFAEEFQIVKVEDTTSPSFSGTPGPVTGAIAPWTCVASIRIPSVSASGGGCEDASISVMVNGSGSFSPGQTVSGLGLGGHTITYIATNPCSGNTATISVPVTIGDDTPPVPVCEDEIVVSLTVDQLNDDGVAKLFASTFDRGSHDAGCGDVWLKVIRMDELNGTLNGYWNEGVVPDYEALPDDNPAAACSGGNGDDYGQCDGDPTFDKFGNENGTIETGTQVFFDDELKVCCNDIGEDIMVVLRVFDRDPGADGVKPYRMEGESFFNGTSFGTLFGSTDPCEGTPLVNDLWGHYNDCMIRLTVQQKTQPLIICPGPVTVSCTDDLDPTVNSGLGVAEGIGLCGDIPVGYDDLDITDTSCGAGTIFRAWFLDLEGDNDIYDNGAFGAEVTYQCQQVITVTAGDDFDPTTIKFPPHFVDNSGNELQLILECSEDGSSIEGDGGFVGSIDLGSFDCVDVPEMCAPEWSDTDCGLVGYSLDTDTVYFDNDACVKILNHWTVIDWCTWLPNSGDDIDTDDYSIDFDDLFFGTGVGGSLADLEDITLGFDAFGDNIEDEGDDPNSPNGDVLISYSDWSLGECAPASCFQGALYNNEYYSYMNWDLLGGGDIQLVDIDGYYNFTQIIKVINTAAPEIANCDDVALSALGGCTADLVVTNSATDAAGCASEVLTWTVSVYDGSGDLIASDNIESGNGEEVSLNVGSVDVGTYTVRWSVTDGCRNASDCTQEYTVSDNKAPTPICLQVLSTAVMDNSGSVTIWASDFNLKSEDNCSAEGDLEYSFSGDEIISNMTYTCDDLPDGVTAVVTLEMWVWDEAGNRDFCKVFLRIDDNIGICPDAGAGSTAGIFGNVSTEGGDMVDNAEVLLNSAHPEYPNMDMTDDSGDYSFGNNPTSADYELTAERNDDYLNGVSTLDLVLIQKHILGITSLDSPYKVIAADINSSESISAADLVELRKLILGIYDELPSNDSWRFVDAGQSFNNVQSPWPFTEMLEINGLSSDMMNEDFIGVKVGDVSGNAVANSLMNTEIRSTGSINLSIEDAVVEAGEVVSVEISSADFNEVLGFQYTLNHKGLNLQSVNSGAINFTDANVGVRSDFTTVSWNNQVAVSSDATLFTLEFKATETVTLSEVLSITSRLTAAEAYVGTSLEQKDVKLVVGTAVASEYALLQNTPNPFDTETLIGFVLPTSSAATLTVYDVNGKTVHQVKGEYTQGYNEISLSKSALGSTGVMYYQLESGDYTATKSMIVIE